MGLCVGSAVSQPIADSLIAEQVEAAENGQNGVIQGGNITGGISVGSAPAGVDSEPLSEIDVSLTGESALKICAVAITLALLSSVAGVIFITKYEPMRILSERN